MSQLKIITKQGNYLSRIAPIDSKGVIELLLSAKVKDDEWNTKNAYAMAASRTKSEYARLFVKKLKKENWMFGLKGSLLSYYLFDLLKNLLKDSFFSEALELADMLLEVKLDEVQETPRASFVDEYHYDEILKEIEKISPEEIKPFIKLLISKLLKLGENAGLIYPPLGTANDRDYRVEDYLIGTLVKIIPDYIKNLTKKKDGKICDAVTEIIGTSNTRIIRRLRLYIYAIDPDSFLECIEANFLNDFGDDDVWGEYNLLLQKAFVKINPELQKKYFSLVEKSPDTKDQDDEYKEHWQKLRLSPVKKYLPKHISEKYSKLLKDIDNVDDPVFHRGQVTSWYGPESPVSDDQLSKMDFENLIKYLISWKPPEDVFFGPSRSGLGQQFRTIVRKNAPLFANKSKLLLSEGLYPTYIYHFLSGLDEAVRNKVELEWDEIIKLSKIIIDLAVTNKLPSFEKDKDDIGSGRDSVIQEIMRLIAHGLDGGLQKLDYKYKKDIWEIIAFTCEDPDPTTDHEKKYGGTNSDPYTMSINTTRGEGFHALFLYIFWCNRNESPDKKFIPSEAQKILERHLDVKIDPSMAIRSVYGRFLPWFLMYGGSWSEKLLPNIFPSDNESLWYAAWETYLVNSVFKEVYSQLRPQYEKAIENLKEGIPQRKYWVNPAERLAEHMMVAYAYEIDDERNPLYEIFFSKAKGKYAGMAVSLGGRAFVNRDYGPNAEKGPDIKPLQKFWEWRLSKSNNIMELKNFGWWVKKDKFDNRWMLERLLETAEKTSGELEGDHLILKGLSELSNQYPLLCSKILNLFVRSVSTRRNHTLHVYIDEITKALISVYKSLDKEAIEVAEKIIEYMTKLGFENLRHVPELAKADKKP